MSSTTTTPKQKSAPTGFAARMLVWLLVVVFALTTIHLTLQYLNLNVFHEHNGPVFEISNRVDMDDESSFPTWFSQALFMAIAIAAFVAAYVQKNRTNRILWLIIATVGFVFSIDEIAAAHEMILQFLHLLVFKESSPTALDNAWMLVLPFVFLGGAWMAYKMYKAFPRRTVVLIVLGGCVLIAGGAFIDILTSTESKSSFYSQGILVAEEETLELVGSVIILYAVVDYLERFHRPQISRALRQLKNE